MADRFSAYAYVTLSHAMDAHNVGKNRVSIEDALGLVSAKVLVIGTQSDQLFPPKEQRFFSKHLPNARYAEVHSNFGHDGFLIENDQLEKLIRPFLNNQIAE